MPSYGHVELIADPTTGRQEIVGTPYHNRAQILIRYRTGDYIRTDHQDAAAIAAIAAGRAPFQGIAGREGEFCSARAGASWSASTIFRAASRTLATSSSSSRSRIASAFLSRDRVTSQKTRCAVFSRGPHESPAGHRRRCQLRR